MAGIGFRIVDCEDRLWSNERIVGSRCEWDSAVGGQEVDIREGIVEGQ